MSGQIMPAPGTPAYLYQQAHASEDLRPGGMAGLIITIVASTTVLATRLYQSRRRRGRWDASDYMITGAWVIAFYMAVTSLVSFRYGMGLHQLRVIRGGPKLNVVSAFKAAYLVSVMQAPCFLLIKLALLHYYKSIFFVNQKYFKWWLWVNVVYIVLWSIATFFYFLLRCLPVSYNWNVYQALYGLAPPSGYHCINNRPNPHVENIPVIIGILGLISDVAVIMTPIVMLRGLKMPLRKKIGLILLFALAFLAIGVSIARIIFFKEQTPTDLTDFTWQLYPSVVWIDVEVLVSIFCACVPASANTWKVFSQRFWEIASSVVSSRSRASHVQDPSIRSDHGAQGTGSSPGSEDDWPSNDSDAGRKVVHIRTDVELYQIEERQSKREVADPMAQFGVRGARGSRTYAMAEGGNNNV